MFAAEPDLTKVKAYIDVRKKEDPARYESMMRAVARARMNRLLRKRWYGNLKAAKREVGKPGWLPRFDFSSPTVHGIGLIDATDETPLLIYPSDVKPNFARCRVRFRSIYRGRVSTVDVQHYFEFYTDTSKFLVGKPATISGLWYVESVSTIEEPKRLKGKQLYTLKRFNPDWLK